jgi:membrane-associated phospholipid phosphatase
MGTSRRIIHRRRLPQFGLGFLIVSVGLGIVLRHNYAGTGIDRWFQRVTVVGARRPGQPGFHRWLFLTLTRTIQVGTGRYLVYFAGVAFVLVAGCAFRDRPRAPPIWYVLAACGPLVALLIAGLSAEEVLKPLINRRMDGNLGVLTYPSGHAVATASVASSIILAVIRLRREGRRSESALHVVLIALIALVPLVVGLEMAVLRSHFLTDVIGGWAWGCGWGLIVDAGWAGGVGAVFRYVQDRRGAHATIPRRPRAGDQFTPTR